MAAKRTILTLEERINVIVEHDKGKSARKLAEMFKCGKTQINNTVKNKEVFLKEWEDCGSRGMKRKRNEKFADVNKALVQWLGSAREKKIPLRGTLIKKKGMQIAESMGIEDFRASNGWLGKFCARNNIVLNSMCGEAADMEDELCYDWKKRLPTILTAYDDRDIFNMDETRLLFQTLPTKSMMEISEKFSGGEHSGEGLTIAVCANAAGEKERLLVISTSQRPPCFRNVDMTKMGVIWKSDSKSWMTSTIFEEWLTEFDEKMNRQQRNVILILDNAPCHEHQTSLKSVKLLFLPENAMGKLQPMDHGIIHCWKLEYRRFVLRRIISLIEDSGNASELVKTISVRDAVSWMISSWENVTSQTIQKCFQAFVQAKDTPNLNIDINFLEEEVMELLKVAQMEYDPRWSDYENALECYDDLSEWEECILPDGPKFSFEEAPTSKVPEINPPALSTQSTLKEVNRLMETSASVEDDKIFSLFMELKNCLENKIATEKLKQRRQ